jgi:peptide/nickel transport system ATP-binding protein
MSELSFSDVSVRYGNGAAGFNAVDGTNLTVPTGAVMGLVGESGSGKSTLARAAVGLTPISQGTITLGGKALSQGRRSTRRQPLQMVFQDPYSSLDPRMCIGSTVSELLPNAVRRSRARRSAEVERLLSMVGLDSDRAGDLPARLSGGQRQRVALARALAARPEVLIADEITSALDVSVQGGVLNLIRDLQRSTGLGILFISHNLAVVRYVSDYLAVMYLGRVVETGRTQEVLSNPQHPYTRELLESVPWPGGSSGASSLEADSVLNVEPPDPHNPPGGCRFHPRCPVGPMVNPERVQCVTQDPRSVSPTSATAQSSACHFPLSTPAAGPTANGCSSGHESTR